MVTREKKKGILTTSPSTRDSFLPLSLYDSNMMIAQILCFNTAHFPTQNNFLFHLFLVLSVKQASRPFFYTRYSIVYCTMFTTIFSNLFAFSLRWAMDSRKMASLSHCPVLSTR